MKIQNKGWITVGDIVDVKAPNPFANELIYWDVMITNIQLHVKGGKGDDALALEIERVPADLTDYFTVDLDNGHWAYGWQLIIEENIQSNIKKYIKAKFLEGVNKEEIIESAFMFFPNNNW